MMNSSRYVQENIMKKNAYNNITVAYDNEEEH